MTMGAPTRATDSIVICPALKAAFVAPLRIALEKEGFTGSVVRYPGLGQVPGSFDVTSCEASVVAACSAMPPGRRGLLGYSTGSFFALRVAARHPGLVDYVVALAPVSDWQALRKYWESVYAEDLLTLLRTWVERQADADKMVTSIESIQGHEQASKLVAQLNVPLLLVQAAADSTVPPDQTALLEAAYPGTASRVVVEGEHFFSGKWPEVARHVRRFVDQVRR